MSEYHIPALLHESLALLAVVPGGKYIDATVGGGGHTAAILSAGGEVLALDQDEEAINYSRSLEALKPALVSRRLILTRSNFSHLTDVVKANAWRPVQGIIIDLGVSSHQLNTPKRGFSFQSEGPLDMRMDQSTNLSAYQIVNELPSDQLAAIFTKFGEVHNAWSLAQKIVSARPIETTCQLARIAGLRSRTVFQAIRIAVNDELGSLDLALSQAIEILSPGGKLLVITFHSLEERLVKKYFSTWEKSSQGSILTPSPILPSENEIDQNRRVKSAKLYCFKKSNEIYKTITHSL